MISNGSDVIIPIAKASIINTALPSAEYGLLTTSITPTNTPSYIRIYVCISVGGVLRIARTVSTTTVVENLNGGIALTASASYLFTVPYRVGDSINIRYSATGGTIYTLRVDEIGASE